MKKALFLVVCVGLMVGSTAKAYKLPAKQAAQEKATKEKAAKAERTRIQELEDAAILERGEMGRVRGAWEGFRGFGRRFMPSKRALLYTAGGTLTAAGIAYYGYRMYQAIQRGDFASVGDAMRQLPRKDIADVMSRVGALQQKATEELQKAWGLLPSFGGLFGREAVTTPTAPMAPTVPIIIGPSTGPFMHDTRELEAVDKPFVN